MPDPRFRPQPPRRRRPRPGPLAAGAGAALLLAAALALAESGGARGEVASGWPAEPPGEIRFEARNLLSTADGVFHRWRLTRVEIDAAEPGAGVVEVEIDVASLATGIDRRDDHLRTSDFFDVERFPLAKVRVRNARPTAENRYTASFELEIHGVSKTVEGSFEVVASSPLEVRGEIALDRMDFEIGTPESRWNPMSIRQAVPVTFRAVLAGGS